MIDSFAAGNVQLPAVLGFSKATFEALDECCRNHHLSHAEAVSILVTFAVRAYAQLPESSKSGDLALALQQRLVLQESLTHRAGVALSEQERINLLLEGLAIEARQLLNRLGEGRS